MKILYFCNLIPDKSGAFEAFLEELGKKITGNKDEFVAVVSGPPISEVASRWHSAGLDWKLIENWSGHHGAEMPWLFCIPALRLISQINPDLVVIHFGNEFPCLLTSILCVCTGRRKIRWVWVQDQQICDPSPLARIASRIKILSITFSAFVAVYEGGKRSLMLRGIPEDRIAVIHNGIKDHIKGRRPGWLRMDLMLHPDVPLAITVGAMIPRKRMEFLLHALADVRRKTLKDEPREKLHLLVIGDGPERMRLETMAVSLDVANCVHFLGIRNDVRDIMEECDMLLHSAVAEACAYSITEAMCAGIPAIVTEAGAAKEQVMDGITGYVLGRSDIDGFAERVVRLSLDSELRRKMGAAARKRWGDIFCVENTACKYLELFELLSGDS